MFLASKERWIVWESPLFTLNEYKVSYSSLPDIFVSLWLSSIFYFVLFYSISGLFYGINALHLHEIPSLFFTSFLEVSDGELFSGACVPSLLNSSYIHILQMWTLLIWIGQCWHVLPCYSVFWWHHVLKFWQEHFACKVNGIDTKVSIERFYITSSDCGSVNGSCNSADCWKIIYECVSLVFIWCWKKITHECVCKVTPGICTGFEKLQFITEVEHDLGLRGMCRQTVWKVLDCRQLKEGNSPRNIWLL